MGSFSVLNWAFSFTAFADEVSCVVELFLHEEVDEEEVYDFIKLFLLKKFSIQRQRTEYEM